MKNFRFYFFLTFMSVKIHKEPLIDDRLLLTLLPIDTIRDYVYADSNWEMII